MTVEIPLTRGAVAIVDDSDAEEVCKFKWYAVVGWRRKSPDVLYAGRKLGPGKVMLMHRLILDAPAHLHVDHINHNTLDNRRSNLRLATPQQNAAHQKPKGRFRGIFPHGNRFWARLDTTVNGKRKIVYSDKSFSTIEEAAKARDALALHYFGEFASLNFPLDHQDPPCIGDNSK